MARAARLYHSVGPALASTENLQIFNFLAANFEGVAATWGDGKAYGPLLNCFGNSGDG